MLIVGCRKWDRKTMASLYTMALVQRRDITSLRDLKKRDVPWLKRLQANIIKGVCAKYPSVEPDQLKLYIHCTPPSLLPRDYNH